MRYVLQVSLPTSFETSNVYSPVSLVSADRIFRVEIIFEKVILYFCPEDNSAPSLNHFGFSSGVPATVNCNIAVSHAVTLNDSSLSRIEAGSVKREEHFYIRNISKPNLKRLSQLPYTFTNLEQSILQLTPLIQHHF